MTDTTAAPEAGSDEHVYLGEMTAVASFGSPQEAQAIKGCLEAAGIPASLGDAQTVQTNMLWANALGGVRVMVPSTLVPRANEVIAEFRGGAFEIEGDDDPALPPAPVATDLALWNPDVAAWLGFTLTPLFPAALHWMNSRKLGEADLARRADIGVVFAIVVTAGAAWLIHGQDWSMSTPLRVSGVAAVFNAAWYMFLGHPQSRFVVRSFGRQYRKRPVWRAGAAVLVAMLAIGALGESLDGN